MFAEKVTLVPGQTAPDGEAEMLMLTDAPCKTDIVISFDMACVLLTQGEFEVSSHEITSPLFKLLKFRTCKNLKKP